MTIIHFVPGNKIKKYMASIKSRKIDKKVDNIIFDLEDSIKPTHKENARKNIEEYLRKNEKSEKIYIRPNPINSKFWDEDKKLIKKLEICGLLLPKVEKEDLTRYEDFINNLKKDLNIIISIESLTAYHDKKHIINSSFNTFAIGYEDISAELGTTRQPIYENNPLNKIIIDCYITTRIYNKKLLGAVTNVLRKEDLNELRKEALFEKNIGMKGKFTIHPNQIPIVNKIFDSEKELEYAIDTVKKFKARKDGSAIIVNSDGKMEDTPSLKRANKIILENESGN